MKLTLLACALLMVSVSVNAADAQRYPYQRCFEIAAKIHNVPLELLLAVAATESNWNADARSKANAHGIMQIQWPGTAQHLGVQRVGELYNPCLNISLGAQYLKELLESFASSEARALAAYNYGPTRIRSSNELPDGAKKYVAKVVKQRARIVAGLIPTALKPQSRRVLVTFDSKTRAEGLAQRIRADIEGATVSIQHHTKPARTYAVMLEVGQAGLTVRDHVLLANMGWTL